MIERIVSVAMVRTSKMAARKHLAETAGNKPEANPEEGVASFALSRMRFAIRVC